MKFGVFFLMPVREQSSPREVLEQTLEQVELAEDLGFDGVWLAEHHFSSWGVCPNVLTLAAALAVRTRRIRIGTGIVVLPCHDPIVVAEQAALVDNLSGGRLDLGVGRGYLDRQFEAFGTSAGEAWARFEEAHDLLLRLWTGAPTTHEGRFYKADALTLLPTPLQRPHPPIWVAASRSPDAITFAARRGYPLLQAGTGDTLAQNLALYRDTGAAAGIAPDALTVALTRAVHVAETTAQARAEMQEPLTWYLRNAALLSSPIKGRDPGSPDDVLETFCAAGDPDECAARLGRAIAAARPGYLSCAFGLGGAPHRQILRSMRLFAQHVMPKLRDPAEESGSISGE